MPLFFFRSNHVYMAGADLPFFVSLEDVKEGAEEKGFRAVQVVDRELSEPPIVLPPAAHKRDWDMWGTGQWGLPDGEIELPEEVAWVADLTPQGPPGPLPGPMPPGALLPQVPQVTVIHKTTPFSHTLAVGAIVALGSAGLMMLARRAR